MKMENKWRHIIPSEWTKKRTQDLFRHPPGGEKVVSKVKPGQASIHSSRFKQPFRRTLEKPELICFKHLIVRRLLIPGQWKSMTNHDQDSYLNCSHMIRGAMFTKLFKSVCPEFARSDCQANGQEIWSQIGAPVLAFFLNINTSL